MFKKLILLLLIVAPISIFAQDKIAYINSREIFSKMPEIKDVETKVMTDREAIEKQLTAIQTEYSTLLEKFSKDTTAINESVLKDREAQLSTLQQRYETYLQNSGAELERKQQELLEPLQQKMMKAVKDVGDENNYTYILDAAAIVHIGANAVDAGPLVKAKLGITN